MDETVPAKRFPWERILIVALLSFGIGLLGYVYSETRGPDSSASAEPYVVPIDMSSAEAFAKLEKAGLVRNHWIFGMIVRSKNPSGNIRPGGYQLSKSMSAFAIANALAAGPTSLWVTIPEGLRKEEIAEIMQTKLSWADESSTAFINVYKTLGSDYVEGVYFPETYLIPVTDGGEKVARRLIRTLNEKLATVSQTLAGQNIRWTTALKVASLVQREAASKADMPIISAVLWNRLEKKQRLEVDATVQYAKGKQGKDWWAPIKSGDTDIDSPYNTYKIFGLPPTPIANPGLDAIRAAAAPLASNCLYYIHDVERVIHCATTFDEHRANIAKYLR